MRLLVSVRDVREADDALAGGADVIDVKEPRRGALGAADTSVARAIVSCVAARKPVSIVLGDVSDARVAAGAAHTARCAGASMVKLGLAGIENEAAARVLIRAVTAHTMPAATVVVAYGDSSRARSLDAERVLDVAIVEGARGLVLDTFDKTGPSLPTLVRRSRLEQLVRRAHADGLVVGVAGKLGPQHVSDMVELDVDLFGVRGAVCAGERTARVAPERVRRLARLLRDCHSAQLATQSA